MNKNKEKWSITTSPGLKEVSGGSYSAQIGKWYQRDPWNFWNEGRVTEIVNISVYGIDDFSFCKYVFSFL